MRLFFYRVLLAKNFLSKAGIWVKYKNNQSVLVVIYAQNSGRVLMLQRRDDTDFWQSVTGSLESGETPKETAMREV